MKTLLTILGIFVQVSVFGQENVANSFKNDYQDVYHLSLIIYTPDGKSQTRVSNLEPNQVKEYALPVGTEIYIADRKQEAFAMKGNDIKRTGISPYLVLGEKDKRRLIALSSVGLKE